MSKYNDFKKPLPISNISTIIKTVSISNKPVFLKIAPNMLLFTKKYYRFIQK